MLWLVKPLFLRVNTSAIVLELVEFALSFDTQLVRAVPEVRVDLFGLLKVHREGARERERIIFHCR